MPWCRILLILSSIVSKIRPWYPSSVYLKHAGACLQMAYGGCPQTSQPFPISLTRSGEAYYLHSSAAVAKKEKGDSAKVGKWKAINSNKSVFWMEFTILLLRLRGPIE